MRARRRALACATRSWTDASAAIAFEYLTPSNHGNLSRHHHIVGSARRLRRARRRRPGDARQRRREIDCAQSAPALQRSCPRGFCRRDRGRLHPLRALRIQARQASGSIAARGCRAGQGLALRSHPAPARGDACCRRQHKLPGHYRHRRRARARARHRCDRLGRRVCASRCARLAQPHRAVGGRNRQAGIDHRRRNLHLHQPEPRHRGAGMMDGGTRDYDVAILGAGLVGLALAASLARAGLQVAIIDRSAVDAADTSPADDDWDARVYAISPGSAAFLDSIGAWQRLPEARRCAIESMEVRGDAGGELTFSAYELGERALAWIVENREIHAALVASVRDTPGIDVLAPRTPASIAWSTGAAELRFDGGDALSTRLIVGADGVRSWTRAQAGMHQDPRPYSQTAVVANFASELANRGRAFQWFLSDGGVLAWLPLPGRRISMVWSAPESLAHELLALDGGALADRVASAGSRALGALTTITAPVGFSLSLLKLPSVIAQRLALVGDA